MSNSQINGTADENLRIDASPTKEFFISVLVRDIKLIDAVKDLIDNCVDGARRLRPDGDLAGLYVRVSIDAGHFMIVDNCGGISAKDARDYVFRFGRPERVAMTEGSIGRFGVGMKRALFKIGNDFKISSISRDSKFELSVNIDAWKRLRDERGADLWEFKFDTLEEGLSNDAADTSTRLEVLSLHAAIAAEFGDPTFLNALKAGLEEVHAQSMDSGLDIEVNGSAIRHKLATLLQSSDLKPMMVEKIFPKHPGGDENASDVKVSIYAGLGESRLTDAGWYVICNGRQVLRADKSKITGWDKSTGGARTPRAHNQFSRFRGYVFFESNDAEALPWNTTKSGINTESSVYRWALTDMSIAMRQVIDFLNELDSELDTESTQLSEMVSKARPVRLNTVIPSAVFYTKQVEAKPPKDSLKRISFKRPADEVEFAKEFFDVTSASVAGEQAFQYFVERERD